MAKKAYIGVSGKARKVKKMYIGVGSEPRELPSGYTQVQYLESTGTQYIDTGFNPSDNSRVLIAVSDISKAGYLFGARDPYTDDIKQGFGAYATSATTIRSDYFTGTITETVDNMIGKETVDKNGNVLKAYGKTITNTTVSSRTVPYPLYLMALNNKGTAAVFSSIKVYSCQIYDNGILIRDFVPCKNASGTGGMYDLVNSKFYTNAGTGTFTVGSTTLSVARRIKKAYIGIGGVARPCFGCGELVYWGKATNLRTPAAGGVAATIRMYDEDYYALLGGGSASSTVSKTIDAYNSSLTQSSTEGVSTARINMASTAVGYYALFGGGQNSSYTTYYKTVDAIDDYLERVSCDDLSVGRHSLAATTVGVDYDAHALFAGGYGVTTTTAQVATVDAYDAGLTRSTATSLSVARSALAATTVGNYALFGGGMKHGQSLMATVDAYNDSLTRTSVQDLSEAKTRITATTVGNYALFGGGDGGSGYNDYTKTVDVYDASLTKLATTTLSVARTYIGATSVGDYAIFCGGYCNTGGSTSTLYKNTVDVFDTSLTRTTGANLSVARHSVAATTIGNYALFGGGSTASSYSAAVDVYTVQ
jgi:hypothetical protein